jgi:hypothetical protein
MKGVQSVDLSVCHTWHPCRLMPCRPAWLCLSAPHLSSPVPCCPPPPQQIIDVNNLLRELLQRGNPTPNLMENWDFLQVGGCREHSAPGGGGEVEAGRDRQGGILC